MTGAAPLIHNAPVRPPLVRLFKGEKVVVGFAGGGGTCEGIKWALGRSPDVAINHDWQALAMHKVNHPETTHHKTDIFEVDPAEASGGDPIGLAWFSPDCTHFSKAKGGKPFRDPRKARRIRGLAWVVVKYARAPLPVKPRVMFVENVEEFPFWGAITKDGRPNKKKIGRNCRRWERAIEREGFVIERRELRAKNYGSRTIRKRLFYIMRRDGQPIVWPPITMGPEATAPIPAWDPLPAPRSSKSFRTAAECIDFSLPVPSIFMTRAEAKAWAREHDCGIPQRPLAINTQRRIARGVFKFVIENPTPFILFEPLGTVVAGGGKHALVAAFLAKHNGGHEATGQRLERPADTITTIDQKALVTSHLMKLYGTCQHGVGVADPMPTVTASGTHIAEVRAFLVKFYGSKKDGNQLSFPLDTVTTIDRFGLVVVTIAGVPYAIVDIGMRMLTPRELYRAQGFLDSYVIDRGVHPTENIPVRFTKRTQTHLCGNAVPPHFAAALVAANLTQARRKVA